MQSYSVTPEVAESMSRRFEAEIDFAKKSQSHLWLAMAGFRVSDQTAKGIAREDVNTEPLFDHETLRTIGFGCFVCEQPLERKLVDRRCPGEPK